MSFCRITGKARGLPKPNYFPLLPPISPADAKRLCRITTKSQGLPNHHYIPALSNIKNVKNFCKVTAKSHSQGAHHYPGVEEFLQPHSVISDYKYVFPKFDEEQKLQKNLINLISSKNENENSNIRFVYSVKEKKTNLVFPPGLEAAVRDGDVRDVMLNQDGDTILIKMYQGPNVTVDVGDFIHDENIVLWEGSGPSEMASLRLLKEKQKQKERQNNLKFIKMRAKIFEDKEKAFEKEEMSFNITGNVRTSKILKKEIPEDKKAKKNHLNDIVYLKEKLLSGGENCEPIFGHIVQSPSSLTFCPGISVVDLPEGKVIPGRIEKHQNVVKFVPGKIIEGKFVPGQMVITNNGEEFVPGQVIETKEGSKFVPGQIVETSLGRKFVPGQTIETENGPQFVPGQIIETKAGPTFIPGQIIITNNEAKFVPGRVIDTSDGPRFVPGRVIETGDQVTFICGQVVETSEGLKFIAPDLENSNDGAQEFSVQGFEIAPEELRLLRPLACHTVSENVEAIDSEILKQLSKAGMSIGRQISTELPKIDIRLLPLKLEKLKFTEKNAIQMAQIVLALAQIAKHVSKSDEICTSIISTKKEVNEELIRAVEQNKNLEKFLRVIIASAVVECREKNSIDEEALMLSLSSALQSTLEKDSNDICIDRIVQTLSQFLTSPENLNQMIIETINYLELKETLQDKIKFVIKFDSEPKKIVKKISTLVSSNVAESFKVLFLQNHSLLKELVKKLNSLPEISSENEIEEFLNKTIVSLVKEKNDEKFEEIITEKENYNQNGDSEFINLLNQCIGLAKALGKNNVAVTLQQVISNKKSHELLQRDKTVMDIIHRILTMRQIAQAKPEFSKALCTLTSNSKEVKNDSSIKELLKHSFALTIVPKKNLESSADIPISLLMSSDTLGMEEYLAETKHPKILLILKSGFQAVVPREASRDVLTGKVPYAVVDEKGFKYFEPLHVFSTMKLPKYAARCFSMYSCPELNYRVDTNNTKEDMDFSLSETKINSGR